MAIKIKHKSKTDLHSIFLPQIEKLWAEQDSSEIARQRLLSTLRGLLIPANKNAPSEFDLDIKFLLEVVKWR